MEIPMEIPPWKAKHLPTGALLQLVIATVTDIEVTTCQSRSVGLVGWSWNPGM